MPEEIIHLEDVQLFEVIGWVVVGCWTFYILFLVRDGAWRMYDPFAQISGMLLYV